MIRTESETGIKNKGLKFSADVEHYCNLCSVSRVETVNSTSKGITRHECDHLGLQITKSDTR